jgi:spore maturation protein A
MAMSWVWTGMILLSLVWGLLTGTGSVLGAAAMEGAASAAELAVGLCGGICLWSGVMEVMEQSGAAKGLSRVLRPVLEKLFPDAKGDEAAMHAISANVSANLLGLGNAATPMGIRAAQRLAGDTGRANPSLCMLVVVNTASLQLLPTTVCALRSALGSAAPFEILPAVWISSILSVLVGIFAAKMMEKLWVR